MPDNHAQHHQLSCSTTPKIRTLCRDFDSFTVLTFRYLVLQIIYYICLFEFTYFSFYSFFYRLDFISLVSRLYQ